MAVFVDNLEKPESLFILDSWAYYFLACEAENDHFNASLVDFLENEVLTECIRTHYNTGFAFYPDSNQWCEKVEGLFSHLNLEKAGNY